jgi:modulator of FtsH protease
MEGWSEFFLGEVGAAAALAGLLVVAISINIERIMANPILPARAAQTVTVIGAAVVISSFALFPQELAWFGWEAIAVAVVMAGAGALQLSGALRRRKPGDPLSWTTVPISFLAIVAVLTAVGGLVLVSGSSAGVYLIALGIIAAMVVTLINGWVLLIEILR